jgi:hypothetical protein
MHKGLLVIHAKKWPLPSNAIDATSGTCGLPFETLGGAVRKTTLKGEMTIRAQFL